MLAIPVLAGAGSAAMAGLIGKEAGFSNSLRQAPMFYGLCPRNDRRHWRSAWPP